MSTIDDAIALTKLCLPPDTTLLLDLALDSSDDTTASLVVTINTSPSDGNTDFQLVVDTITDSFHALGVPQQPLVGAITYSQGSGSDPAPGSSPPPSS